MQTTRRNYVDAREMKSNIYKLEHMVFTVRVAYIDLMDINEIQRYGTVTFGDAHEDKCNANEKVTVALTIPKLLELYRKQAPFYLTDKSQEHLIYNIIHTHILEWAEYVESVKGIRHYLDKVPYDDLKDLSAMASVLYAARDRTKDLIKEIDTHMSMFDRSGGLITASMAIAMQEEEDRRREELKKDQHPHLEDMAKLDSLFARRRR